MKIAHVVPSLDRGGAEQVVISLANRAVARGDEVTIITAGPPSDTDLGQKLNPGVNRLAVTDRPTVRFAKYGALLGFIRRNRAWLRSLDVIHVHLLFGTLAGGLFELALGHDRPKIVETFHAAGMPLAAWKRRLTSLMARSRDAFVLMADDPALVAAIGREVAVIPNGVELPQPAETGAIATFREQLGIDRDAPLITTVGRLVPERMPDRIVELLRKIAEVVPQAHFAIGGDGPLRQRLEASVIAMGLNDRIHFLGMVEQPALLMSASDLYISINVRELSGIAGLEAAGCGTPVIALQADLAYRSGHSDWIWSDSDTGAVAAKAIDLVSDGPKSQAIGNEQRRTVEARFSAAAMSEAYLALYRSLLNEATSPSSLR